MKTQTVTFYEIDAPCSGCFDALYGREWLNSDGKPVYRADLDRYASRAGFTHYRVMPVIGRPYRRKIKQEDGTA